MRKIMGHNRKGFVLVLSLLTTVVLLALVTPYVSRIATDYRLTSKIYNSAAALNLAEAGVERAFWEIAHNSGAFSGITPTHTCDADGVVTGHTYSSLANSFQDSTGRIVGDYDISAWVSFDAKSATITGTGYAPNKLSYDARRKIKITCEKNNFNKAIGAQGNGGISLGQNSIVDSYNSDSGGTYATTHSNSDGDIATNGPIDIPSNTHVYGDANPGEGHAFSEDPASVSGTYGTLAAPLAYAPIPRATLDGGIVAAQSAHSEPTVTDPPSFTLVGHDLTVLDHKTANLSGGTYYFTSITLGDHSIMNVNASSTIYVQKIAVGGGNISVCNHGEVNLFGTTAIYMNRGGTCTTSGDLNVLTQGNLSVSGQTTFYVDGGNISLDTQGDINNTGVPKNLIIYSTGTNITLITQANFFGAIYAPNAYVSLTSATAGGQIYGAVICDSFDSGTNTGIHFDKALLNLWPIFLSSIVTSWQEIT